MGTDIRRTVPQRVPQAGQQPPGSKLIRDDDEVVYGDSGYGGLPKREEIKSDQDKSLIDYRINIKPSLQLTKSSFNGYNWEKSIEHRKSAARCKVEHIFLTVKRHFGYSKVVYRGIAKNFNRFYVLFASANIVMCPQGRTIRRICPGISTPKIGQN